MHPGVRRACPDSNVIRHDAPNAKSRRHTRPVPRNLASSSIIAARVDRYARRVPRAAIVPGPRDHFDALDHQIVIQFYVDSSSVVVQSEVRIRVPIKRDIRAPAPTMVRWVVCEYLPMLQIGSALPRRLVPGGGGLAVNNGISSIDKAEFRPTRISKC